MGAPYYRTKRLWEIPSPELFSALAQKIRHLPPKEQAKLFDKIAPLLEDYFLTKIADDRLRKPARKRIAWDELNP